MLQEGPQRGPQPLHGPGVRRAVSGRDRALRTGQRGLKNIFLRFIFYIIWEIGFSRTGRPPRRSRASRRPGRGWFPYTRSTAPRWARTATGGPPSPPSWPRPTPACPASRPRTWPTRPSGTSTSTRPTSCGRCDWRRVTWTPLWPCWRSSWGRLRFLTTRNGRGGGGARREPT